MATKIPVPTAGGVITGGAKAFDDLAELIKNPPADRPIQAAIGAAGQKYCNFIGALPGNASGLLGLGLPLQALLCKPYWDDNGYDAPQEVVPFTGGQCAICYRVVAEWDFDGVFGQTQTEGMLGPIGGIRVIPNGSSSSKIQIFARGRSFSTTNCTFIMGTVGAGWIDISAPGVAANRVTPRIVSVTPTGSGVDNCGNLPGVLEPGDNPPPTPTFPPGEEPGVEPTGQPFFFVPPIPSPIGDEPVEVPEPPYDAPGGGTGGPTAPPVAGGDETGGDGDNDFGEPPEGRRWVGCCISLSIIPAGTGTVPGTSPETILTQVVGNARLLFDSASGDGYDTPVQIRSAGLCLWEPVKGLSPTGVRVNLKPGFTFSYTPYSVPEEN